MTAEFPHPIYLSLGDTEAQHDATWSADDAGNCILEQVKVGTAWISAATVQEWVGAADIRRQTEIVEAWWSETGQARHDAAEREMAI